MITTTLLRRNTLPILRPSATIRSLHRSILTARRQTGPPWPHTTLQQRLKSTSVQQAPKPTSYKYPELLTVFVAPYSQTITVGVARIVSFGLVLYSAVFWAPFLYASSDHNNWLVPAAILVPLIPLSYALAMGPFVSNVSVRLPPNARLSRDSLFRFAANVPRTTRLQLKFLRLTPFGVKREIDFADFRRLPPTWTRLANLEHIPYNHVAREALLRSERGGKKVGLAEWFTRTYWGRYWVNMTTTLKDRSPVPGVWDKMWDQIPWIGESDDAVTVAAKGMEKEKGRKPPAPAVKMREHVKSRSRR